MLLFRKQEELQEKKTNGFSYILILGRIGVLLQGTKSEWALVKWAQCAASLFFFLFPRVPISPQTNVHAWFCLCFWIFLCLTLAALSYWFWGWDLITILCSDNVVLMLFHLEILKIVGLVKVNYLLFPSTPVNHVEKKLKKNF